MKQRGGPAAAPTWDSIHERLRERGMRWTPQRRLLLEVLSERLGHVTAVEVIERCRERDPDVTPSTIHRTLEVLESLGLVAHGHGIDGTPEYHLLPEVEHGHLYCRRCRQAWEIRGPEAAALASRFDQELGFQVDLSHVTIVGVCGDCRVAV
ncbi:MAG: Fur family transcriptional regulator [Chloroflexota bacterium]